MTEEKTGKEGNPLYSTPSVAPDQLIPYHEEPGIKIYHGDAEALVAALDEVDLVLTDPPYGIGKSHGGRGSFAFGGKNSGKAPGHRREYPDEWDHKRPPRELLRAVVEAGALAIVFGGNYFADLLPASTHWIVWDKLNTAPTFSDCELAWTSSPRRSVMKITIESNGMIGAVRGRRVHPTQKPLSLMKWCIDNYSSPGDMILDPFMGSGTTLLAAKDLGRRAIGIEREEKYCKIARDRLAQEVLFPGDREPLDERDGRRGE